MRRLLPLGVALLLPLAGGTPAHAQDRGSLTIKPEDGDKPLLLYSKSVALVIGIDEYTNGWRPLRNAVKDAEAVAEALKQIGFEVRLETSAQVDIDPNNRDNRRPKVLTGSRIYQIIREFLYQVGYDREARIFIWFAGHGESIKAAWTGARSTGYLIGADAPNPASVAADKRSEVEAQMKQRSVSLAQLGALVDEIPAKHIMGVFDSCFAGTIFSGTRDAGPPPTIRRNVSQPTRLFYTSGAEGQTVRDDGRFRTLFVDAVLGRVRADRNNDGYLTGKELGLFLEQEMSDSLKADHTPQFGPMHGMASSEGDFVFTISKEALEKLNVPPERPAAEVLHERFWGFVREEKSPPLIDRFVTAFPDTPFKETAVAHAKRMREPTVVSAAPPTSGTAPPRDTGGGGRETSDATPPADPVPSTWWRQPGVPVTQSTDMIEVPVLFGTDRGQTPTGFGNDRSRRLVLGGALVTVPSVHQVGQIERPWNINIPFQNISIYKEPIDPKRHFKLELTKLMPASDFKAVVTATNAGAKVSKGQALLYIHGTNMGFEDAVLRGAQLSFDLGFDGPVLVYSWPAGDQISSYTYDRESAQSSAAYLQQFIEAAAAQTGLGKLHIVAHGLGAHPVMQLLEKPVAIGGTRIGQVILAAPDIDRDIFTARCATAAQAVEGITLYASRSDRALEVSRRLSGGAPRAGEVPAEGPLVHRCVRTIDVSAAADLLGVNHSAFSNRRSLLADLKSVLSSGRTEPDKRNPALSKVETAAGPYWRLVSDEAEAAKSAAGAPRSRSVSPPPPPPDGNTPGR